MAIKAILRKNTPEIREKIRSMGITCTEYGGSSSLNYNELSHAVYWWDGDAPKNTLDCGDNEELFFALLNIRTLSNEEIKPVFEDNKYLNERLSYYRQRCGNLEAEKHVAELESSAAKHTLNVVLENLVNKKLEKEHELLKEKYEELQKENEYLKSINFI